MNEILEKLFAEYYDAKRVVDKTNNKFDKGVVIGIEKAIKIIQTYEHNKINNY